MNKTNTKRALLLSLVSLMLCFSMMLGTTFAWFTDSVNVANNRIVAGNLDVELFYDNASTTGFENVTKANAKMFVGTDGEEILWEPGAVAYTNFEIRNVGNLALKYAMNVVVTDETTTTVDGEVLSLEDVIKVAVLPGETVDNREAAIAKANASGIKFSEIATNGDLLPNTNNVLEEDEYDECAVVLYWAPNADDIDNKYNLNNKRQDNADLDITFDITLVAAQLTHEDDSFGNDYDAGASWVGSTNIDWYLDDPDATEFIISTAEELAGLASIVNGTAVNPASTFAAGTTVATITDDFKGDTIYLGADIDLADILWTPIGTNPNPFRANFDGQGHTIYNLNVNNDGWAGLIGHAGLSHAVTIKNLNIVGATINSNRMAGAIVGQLYGNIDNCTVTDAYIKVVPNAVDGGYDNGDKVGGIVGWIGDNNNNRTLTNCSVSDLTVSAYRDVGGIAGYVAWSTTIANNSVSGSKVIVDQSVNNYGEKDPNAGAIWGRNSVSGTGVGVISENNNAEDVLVETTYVKDGMYLVSDSESDEVLLYSVPADYADDTVNVPDGVKTIGGYAFAYNTNVDKIVLPSTVTTLNDRAFRDTSASTVVLNEGLENISYQAFKNAHNVKEVEIPSTVKTISKEAFQNSGVETLTIPSTVETLEYGAMRDMKNLVSVTIESDADIPVYAFRACTNLKTVIITSEDVTFGGGSRGMIFTNTENGNGSAMTIYVASEEVKARLIAADTAAKDYGGYKIVVISEDSVFADTAEDVVEAVKNGENVIMTDDVTAPLSQSAIYGTPVAIIQKNGGVIDGGGNSLIIKNPKYEGYAIETYGGTIKNLTIDTEVGRGIVISSPKEDIHIDNVVIDGPGYAINTTEHQARNLYITNSTVNGWTSLAGLTQVTFTDCRLGENNAKYWQNMGYDQDYDRLVRPYVTATFEDCEFEQGYYIDLSALGADCTVTLDNCNTNGTVITEENYASYITIELPAGRTFADCVVFA